MDLIDEFWEDRDLDEKDFDDDILEDDLDLSDAGDDKTVLD